MGLLAEIYSVFGLGYTIALGILKHDDFSRSDKAFLGATVAFLVLSILSFFKQLCDIPWGYKCRFFWKSLARGLLGPLPSLFYYPVLFGSSKCVICVKKALTFSNEAYDGVERTRQLQYFELTDNLKARNLYLTTHDLFRYGEEWGYDRLVGEIWVRVRFKAQFDVGTIRELQTSDWGTKLLLQYKRPTPSSPNREPIIKVTLPDKGSVNVPEAEQVSKKKKKVSKAEQESVKCSCLPICEDLESGSNLEIPGTPDPPTLPATPDPPTLPATPDPPILPATPDPPILPATPDPPILPATPDPPILPATPDPPILPATPDPPTLPATPDPPTLPATPDPPTLPATPDPPTPPTPPTPPELYTVTITRRRAICRTKRSECCCPCLCPGCMWNLKCRVVRRWNLFQIHQYMLCLDVWGNHPKQGIWKPEEPKACCSGCTSCSNACSTRQLFRFCYRHDKLIDAIHKGKRLTRTSNNGTRYAVV